MKSTTTTTTKKMTLDRNRNSRNSSSNNTNRKSKSIDDISSSSSNCDCDCSVHYVLVPTSQSSSSNTTTTTATRPVVLRFPGGVMVVLILLRLLLFEMVAAFGSISSGPNNSRYGTTNRNSNNGSNVLHHNNNNNNNNNNNQYLYYYYNNKLGRQQRLHKRHDALQLQLSSSSSSISSSSSATMWLKKAQEIFARCHTQIDTTIPVPGRVESIPILSHTQNDDEDTERNRNHEWKLKTLNIWNSRNNNNNNNNNSNSDILIQVEGDSTSINLDTSIRLDAERILIFETRLAEDIQIGEGYLMTAMHEITETHSTVMNSVPLLTTFEQFFHITLRLAELQHRYYHDQQQQQQQQQQHHCEVTTKLEQLETTIMDNRMGLASLFMDQEKYYPAAIELHKIVTTATTPLTRRLLDRAYSLLFRCRASICDWHEYSRACAQFQQTTTHAVAPLLTPLTPTAAAAPSRRMPPPPPPPAVHPFEALTWPCFSLYDSTAIAHTYALRAVETARRLYQEQRETETNTKTLLSEERVFALLPWTNLHERLRYQEERATQQQHHSIRNSYTQNQNHNNNMRRSTTYSKKRIRIGYISPDFTGKHP